MPRLSRLPKAPRRQARASAPPAGLTLIELLLAMVILAIVMTAIMGMFTAQQRLYGRTREAADVQRDLRMGLSMLPADLRSAAPNPVVGASDLTALSDSGITVRATIGQSIICKKEPGPGTDVFTVYLPAKNLARHTLTSWHAEPVPGEIVLFYNDSTSVGPEDDYWDEHHVVGTLAPVVDACKNTPFVDPVKDAGKTGYKLVVDRKLADSVRVGAGVRFLRWARYSLFKPTGGGADAQWYLGYAEQPGLGAWDAMEPIAGPFRPAGGSNAGITFNYFDVDGNAIAAPVDPRKVVRVDLTFRAQARVRGAGATEYAVRDSVALRVALRNRPIVP